MLSDFSRAADTEGGLDSQSIDPNDPEANRAATKIQAAFRGHQTRKSMKQGDGESKQNLDKEFSSEDKGPGKMSEVNFLQDPTPKPD
ncbi:hypothetical protein RUM44_007344 [Polyplax serrata]|uniref:Neurogranin n=1 Tax=Polyplax serrata TaxID=468196 RepID=A0ABR1B0F2_POLSC